RTDPGGRLLAWVSELAGRDDASGTDRAAMGPAPHQWPVSDAPARGVVCGLQPPALCRLVPTFPRDRPPRGGAPGRPRDRASGSTLPAGGASGTWVCCRLRSALPSSGACCSSAMASSAPAPRKPPGTATISAVEGCGPQPWCLPRCPRSAYNSLALVPNVGL